MISLRHLVGLLWLVTVIGSCGARLGAPPDDASALPAACVTDAPVVRTAGMAAYATLGPGTAPDLAAFHGEMLSVTSIDPCTDRHDLVLWQLDTRSKASTAIPLGVTTGGLWHGMAVAEDGTIWVGTRDMLVHVHRDRSLELIRVPVATSPVPAGFISRAGARNAVGAITAVAVVGDTLLLGRAGHQEITAFDVVAQHFRQIPLPAPFGEVKSMVAGPGSSVIFTATRSIADPHDARDATGSLDVGASRIEELPISGVLAASGDSIASATWTVMPGAVRSVLAVDDARGTRSWSIDAQPYDATRIAVRPDGSIAVRAAGVAAEVAFIGPDGMEARRVAYAAARLPSTTTVPALAFAAFGPGDALWFAVRGRPEIYRIK